MIKNLIFDLDDTIIRDEKSDALVYKEALRKLGYDEEDYWNVYSAIDKYEDIFTEEKNLYDKKELIDFINKVLNKNYAYELMDELLRVAEYWTKNIILSEDTVKRLSEKYDLYVYTNYFEKSQENRIEKIGYSKYFKGVFGADIYGSKPFKSSFEKVLKKINATPDECIMIGDTKSKDILAANKIGMKSILYDYDGKRDKKDIELENYIVIKDMDELLDII